MNFACIDFETFYGADYTLSKMTTESYVRDPRFEVIGVGINYNRKRYWMEEHQWRTFARQVDWSTIGLLAHHAHFDGLICSHHYDVRPGWWFDTLSMARALHGQRIGNSLAKLMLHYGVGVKGTDVEDARGKRRVDFTPEQWRRYGEYCLNDTDGTIEVFKLMQRGFPRSELELIDITIRMFTEPVFVLDEAMMLEYQRYEIERKAALLEASGADKRTLSSGDKFAALLREYGIEPPTKLNPKGKTIYAFAKTDPGMQELLEDQDEDVRLLCEARIAIKSTGNVTRSGRMLAMGAGGRPLPVYLKYAGAHTYRWSGADGVNWQNFERPNKLNPRKGVIRKAIRAPKGYLVVGGDAAQIEPRWNAWYSGESELVLAFARGEDVYSKFASLAFGRPIDRKKVAADEIPGHVGKTCVLGLGYSMGWLKFGGEVLKGANGAPPITFTRDDLVKLNIDPQAFLANPENVERITTAPSRLPLAERMIHYAVANHFVQVYRASNSRIKANWRFMDEVIKMMARGETGVIGKNGLIEVVPGGLKLLPSGMTMHYDELRLNEAGEYTYLAKRGKRAKLYGGLLTENLTQAFCRIIISDAMIDLSREGLKIALMEHDAVAGVAPAEEAPYWSKRLLDRISTPPAWAADLPLAAEGGFGETYGATK